MIKASKENITSWLMCCLCIAALLFATACETTSSSNGVNSPYKFIGSTFDDDDDNDGQVNVAAVKDLEQRVQILENDFAVMKPSIENLIAIESDIQELIGELAKLTDPTNPNTSNLSATSGPATLNPAQYPFNTEDNEGNAINTPADLMAQIEESANNIPKDVATTDTPEKPKTSANPVTPAPMNTVTDIRFGQHQNKVRVVIDYSKGTTPDYDIYKEGDAVILEVMKAMWDTKKSQNFSKLPLIKRYSAEKDGDKTKISFETRGDDMTVKIFTLPPLTSSKGPRLVIDFERGVS